MLCADTTFLIDLIRGEPDIKDLLDEFAKKNIFISIGTPSIMELWMGACLIFSEKEKEKINEMLKSFEILPLDVHSAKIAGEIECNLEKKGRMIQTEDIMIAAIAIVHGKKVLTRDKGYANIDGLRILKY